ncbi:MAG: hypothetical protein AABY22_12465 [Nanoarchaeota archaeon]
MKMLINNAKGKLKVGDWVRTNNLNELLLDQLYRLEGILGKYNCQYGGIKCEFQTNCHRLIREEIELLKNSELKGK